MYVQGYLQGSENGRVVTIDAKTMSADGSHLGWRSGSQDIILKVNHLRTIHAIFIYCSLFLCSIVWDDRWLFLLLVELLTITV
jgi:hypothetical protein